MEAGEEFIILPVDICRICNMLSPNLNRICERLADEPILIHEALEFVSCLKVDFGDGMSETMCPKCCNNLLHAYRFKNQVLESYRFFYNKNTDFNVKKEISVIDDCDSTITLIEENNFVDYKPQQEEEPKIILERVKELEIDLTIDAISFLREQHRTNEALSSIEQSQIEEDQRSNTESNNTQTHEQEQHSTIEQSQMEEDERSYMETHNNTQTREQHGSNEALSLIEQSPMEEDERPHMETNNNTLIEQNQLRKEIKTDDCPKPRTKKVKCDVCHKMLPKKSNLIDHMRLHTNDKQFICNFCEKSFVQVANYRAHLRVHTKERPFQCHMCSKAYQQAHQLKTHIRSHTKEKNYECEVCSKKFLTSSDLGKHKGIHDPNLQFPCHICGQLFVQKVNLRIHLEKGRCEEKLLQTLICI